MRGVRAGISDPGNGAQRSLSVVPGVGNGGTNALFGIPGLGNGGRNELSSISENGNRTGKVCGEIPGTGNGAANRRALVPKLLLGHALVREALLRRGAGKSVRRVGAGAGKRNFRDRGIPKQELGNEGRGSARGG